MTTSEMTTPVVTVSTWQDAYEAFRRREFKQARFTNSVAHGNVALPVLHGEEHRARRRVENPLFRRETVLRYEKELFPQISQTILKPYLAQKTVDLVPLGMEWTVGIAALTAGVDLPDPVNDAAELSRYIAAFNASLLSEHAKSDHERLRRAAEEALENLERNFLRDSIRRRLESAASPGSPPPSDVLGVLLANRDTLGLSDNDILHEVATYLVGGTHTSAVTMIKTVHHIFAWVIEKPGDLERLKNDRSVVQKFVYESLRLYPSNPTAERWALEDVTLASGVEIPAGARVVIDISSANRDPLVFGEDAAEFNPFRSTSNSAKAMGLSFGAGMHACIGQHVAAGLPLAGDGDEDSPYGLVPAMVQTLLNHGMKPHPTRKPVPDHIHGLPLTYLSYPVALD